MESKIIIKLKIKGQWVELTKSEFIQLRAEMDSLSIQEKVFTPFIKPFEQPFFDTGTPIYEIPVVTCGVIKE